MQEQIIISLGSNLGNRITYLFKALALLEMHSISVKTLSGVYESPAWGFESTPFYNACATLETTLTPHALLEVLLQVEQQLGRKRMSEKGYTARTIDLDLLFFNAENIYTDRLHIPHPKLHKRNFVLAPLLDIAPTLIHPILFQTVEDLFKMNADSEEAVKTPHNLGLPPIFKHFPYLVIEGNIGVGKTTLATQLASHYKADLRTESFAKNPYLEVFYQDSKTHALAVENFFLTDRFKQESIFWEKAHVAVVADYSLYKSLVFAAENLNTSDYRRYFETFEGEINTKKLPSLMVFLNAPVSKLQKQIKIRGRTYEQGIKMDYLERLAIGYEALLQRDLPFPVLNIAVEELDFEHDQIAFQRILRTIFRASFL